MQRLCALGDKVLHVAVNQADHGTLHVEAPCQQLGMRREDRVGTRDFGGADGGAGGHKISIELSSALRREGSLVQRLLLHHYGRECSETKPFLKARFGPFCLSAGRAIGSRTAWAIAVGRYVSGSSAGLVSKNSRDGAFGEGDGGRSDRLRSISLRLLLAGVHGDTGPCGSIIGIC